MNQSKAQRLIPKLRYKLHERRNLKNPEGPQGRHNKIRKIVTALLKYERIEMCYPKADETRGYAERLISDAIRYGDCHQPTMEMASYWLVEEQVVHKLFKVLVPRYKNFGISYTRLWKAPNIYPGHGRPKCVIELRNNIFPSLSQDKSHNKNLIHNVLLDAARKAFNAKKAAEASEAQTDNVSAKEETSDSAASADSEFVRMSTTDAQSEENVINESVSEKEAVSALEEDLSKLEIKEEKPKESPSEEEKRQSVKSAFHRMPDCLRKV